MQGEGLICHASLALLELAAKRLAHLSFVIPNQDTISGLAGFFLHIEDLLARALQPCLSDIPDRRRQQEAGFTEMSKLIVLCFVPSPVMDPGVEAVMEAGLNASAKSLLSTKPSPRIRRARSQPRRTLQSYHIPVPGPPLLTARVGVKQRRDVDRERASTRERFGHNRHA